MKFLVPKFPVVKLSAAKSLATNFIAVKMSSGEIFGGEICRTKHITAKICSLQPLQTLNLYILKSRKKFNNYYDRSAAERVLFTKIVEVLVGEPA